MEPHQRFNIMVYWWLRFVGLLLGQDIFSERFRIHSYTVIVTLIGASLPICSIWTFFFDDKDRALDGGSFVFANTRVSRKIYSEHIPEEEMSP